MIAVASSIRICCIVLDFSGFAGYLSDRYSKRPIVILLQGR